MLKYSVKYYISTYKITMLGLLIDEEEFEVTPGITRQVSLFEFDTRTPSKRAVIEPPNPKDFTLDFLYVTGNTSLTEVFRYTANIEIIRTENLKTCFYLYYTSTTTNTLGYVSCVGTPTTIPLTNGSTGNVCVKGGTTPTLSNVTGGTLSSSSSCFGSYSVNITRDGVSYYLGDDISPIQIINGDTLSVAVNKLDPTRQSIIYTNVTLV